MCAGHHKEEVNTMLWLFAMLLGVEAAYARLSDKNIFNTKPDRPATPPKQWAILVAGSKTYSDYRHQADICHAYQLLRARGIREERIVVMMYDNIANNTENPTPGVILNHPDGPNVYEGVPKDYTGDLVTPDNFLQLLQGVPVDGGSGKVIASNRFDNIFIFFSGHGGPGLLDFPNGGALKANQLIRTIISMHRAQRYNKMVIYVDACLSGSLFDHRLPTGLNVYATTSAKPYQSSYSCYWDSYRNVPLGDEYSVRWMEFAEDYHLNAMSLGIHFAQVQRETKESYVMEYGDLNIRNTKASYFLGLKQPKPVRRRKLPCDSPSNPDVTVNILSNKVNKTKDPITKKTFQQKLRQMLNNRAFLESKVAEIAAFIAREKKEIINSLLTSEGSSENADCYEDAVSYFDVKCFSLSENPYALQHLRVLVNACSSGYPFKDITDAMDAVCTHSTIQGIQ